MKKIIFILTIILFAPSLYASKPLVGVVGIHSVNPAAFNIYNQIRKHVINVIETTGAFSLVNPVLLNKELIKFECLEENCILSFAKTAGINLIITGDIDERHDDLIMNLYSYGIEAPYFGSVVYEYKVKISTSGLRLAESQIIEEHVGYFISGLLEKFRMQVFLKGNDDKFVVDSEENINGNYSLCRYDKITSNEENIRTYKHIGTIDITNNQVETIEDEDAEIAGGDFIFITNNDKADFLEDFYYGRKREIVFGDSSITNDFFLFFLTVPASALMPVVAPLGHYKSSDFKGLSLWTLNALPYLYLEYDGLINRPGTFRDDNKSIPRKSFTRYRFGLYMLLCGGMPLLMDVYSRYQLHLASNYQRVRPVFGSRLSTAFLSLISGGGGLFYRGYRIYGSLYFHAHNILLYSVIKELSRGESYNIIGDSYEKDEINKMRAYAYLGAFGLVKIVEIFHALLVKDRIRNGEIINGTFSFEPDVRIDRNANFTIGAKYSCRF